MGRQKTVQTELPRRMRKRRQSYYYDHGIVDGKRWREPLGNDYKKALQRYAEIEAGTPSEGTVAAILDDYTTHALPRKKPRTQKDERGHMKRLRATFGRMAVADLEPHHIARYLRRHPTGPVMANREIATLSMALSWAVEQGLASENVTRQVSRNREQSRKRRVTADEFNTVYQLGNEAIQIAMDLAYSTAMRRGDLLAVSWAQVSDEGLAVRAEKTDDMMLLEWSPRLANAVERARELSRGLASTTILCRRDGQPYTGDGFSAMWQRVMTKAVAQGVRRFTFHDLRAMSATDAKEAGLDSQSLLGHRTEAQHQAYLRSREVRRVTPL